MFARFHASSSVSAATDIRKKEDRGHVVTLSDAHALEDSTYFFVDFEYDCEIGIHCLDGSNKLGWGTIFLENL